MGRASSAKKVARAARAGGAKTGKRKNLGFPIGVGAIVLLGLALLVFSRGETAGAGPPEVGDHWHAAYGIYVCDRFIANVPDRGPDKLGIHTHDDGLIHIHPFLGGAAGRNATVNRFFEQTGLEVTSDSLVLPPGAGFKNQQYVEGETECGGKPATVQVAHWDDATKAEAGDPDQVITNDIGSIRLTEDLGAYTFAFVPKGTEIPPPPGSASIVQDGAADGAPGEAPESTQPGDDPQVPVDPGGGVPGDPGSVPEGSIPVPEGSTPVPEGSAPVPEGSEPPPEGSGPAPTEPTPPTSAP